MTHSGCRIFLVVSVLTALVVLGGCTVQFKAPQDALIKCSDTSPCSAGLICAKEHKVCVQEEPICGNNIVEFPEACDDGFRDACGSCNETCTADGGGSTCGDGERCPEYETCDDGNTVTETCAYGQAQCLICNETCEALPGLVVGCGDGVRNRGSELPDNEFEVCDDAEPPRLCSDLSSVFSGGLATCSECRRWDTTLCETDTLTPELMVSVPEGPFPRGCGEVNDPVGCDDDELPLRQIQLSDFAIDTYEVTVERYAECVMAGGCTTRELDINPTLCNWTSGVDARTLQEMDSLEALGRPRYPINCINWYDAETYCQWAGKRLPTEAEWEKSARGNTLQAYPWGNGPLPSCNYAVMSNFNGEEGCGTYGSLPVGSRPDGVSPYGAHDMIGNVYEWVQDWYDPDYYATSFGPNPPGPDGSQALLYNVVKGGAWDDDDEEALRIPYRNNFNGRSARDFIIGLRCVAGEPLDLR